MNRRHGFAAWQACLILLAGTVLPQCGTAWAREEVLAWDDGESDGAGYQLEEGWLLAVGFEAPEWACSLEGLQCYLQTVAESPPGQGSVFARVWCGSSGQGWAPGDLAYLQLQPVWFDTGDAGSWLEVRFSVPPDLTDDEQFPGGRFFIGVEWFSSPEPSFGIDEDAPVALRTVMWNWEEWEQVGRGDGMIRAIVSDIPTPVESGSWGTVKALYRGRH